MENFLFREAKIEDLNILLNFEQFIITAERPFDSTLKDQKISYYDLKHMIVDENCFVVVGEIDSKIIASGYGKIEKSKPYLNHNYHCYLGFMYVDEKYRGKGINQKLIESIKKWALSKNIFELQLDVYSQNVTAISAYTKFGFQPNLVQMRMKIDC